MKNVGMVILVVLAVIGAITVFLFVTCLVLISLPPGSHR
jgi:hypothetical protein